MDEAERCAALGYIFEGELIAYGTIDELRRLPGVETPGSMRYRVTVDNIMAAFSAATHLAYVRESTIFGRDLHLVVDATIPVQRLRDDLLTAAGRIEAIDQIEPSVEDVFVALTRRRSAA